MHCSQATTTSSRQEREKPLWLVVTGELCIGLLNNSPEAITGFRGWHGSADLRIGMFYISPPRLGQRVAAGVDGVLAELLLNAQELVVFRQTVGAAEGAGLDLAAVRGHRDVGDEPDLSAVTERRWSG
jgi:hypothetical protein